MFKIAAVYCCCLVRTRSGHWLECRLTLRDLFQSKCEPGGEQGWRRTGAFILPGIYSIRSDQMIRIVLAPAPAQHSPTTPEVLYQ